MATILVADDEPRIRMLLRLTLEPAYHVIEAAHGAQALQLLREMQPDIALLDVAMPILDGLAVCRTVRAEPSLRQMGIIVISANSNSVAALSAGADRYLPKPFRPAELLRMIGEVLAERRGDAPLRWPWLDVTSP